MNDDEYRALLLGHESQASNVLDNWNDHYIAECKLPEPYRSRQLEYLSLRQIAKVYGEKLAIEVGEARLAGQVEHELQQEMQMRPPERGPIIVKRPPRSQEFNDAIAASLPPGRRPKACTVCGELLPVGSIASRTMHDKCSKRGRMARYRQKKKDEATKQRLRAEGKLQDKG